MSIEKLVAELEERLASNGDVNYLEMIQSSNLIQRIASFVIGALSLLIMITVPIIVSIEIIYICFPVIREKTDELIFKVEERGYARNVIGFTLRDAIEAVKEANTTMIGERSALWIYMKLKLKSIMFLMFIVVFVLRGSSSVINFVDSLFRGVIETIFF